jgi:hypothetical protein
MLPPKFGAVRGIGGGDASLTRSRDGYATGMGRTVRAAVGFDGRAAADPAGEKAGIQPRSQGQAGFGFCGGGGYRIVGGT